MSNEYKRFLKEKIAHFTHEVYRLCRKFPKEELFITTVQFKRAALSVLLNYSEGYARFTIKNQRNFLEICFGSIKESLTLIEFCKVEGFIDEMESVKIFEKGDEIAGMLWKEIQNVNKSTSGA